MPEVPKIVNHRLRAAMTAPEALAHPEADMLAAFAEQGLPTPERDSVLRHLALCADCRDVIALALPAVDVAIRPVEEEEEEREVVVASASAGRTSSRGTSEERKSGFSWSGFAWANLRWATLAAGIAVAVFVMRPAWEHLLGPHASVNSAANQGTKPSVAPAPASQVASVSSAANSLAAKDKDEEKEKKDKNEAGKHETTTARDKSLSRDSRYGVESKSSAVVDGAVIAGVIDGRVDGRLDKERSEVLRRPSKTTPSESPMRLAGNMVALGGKKQSESGVKDSAAATPAPGAMSKSELGKPAMGAATETVAVSGGAEEVTSSQLNATLPTEDAALQNAPAIEKAKPALDETAVNEKLSKYAAKAATSSPAAISLADKSPAANSQGEVASKAQVGTFAMGTAAPSATMPRPATKWTITDGVLQRSFDEGHTWQSAARADHTLLCYANRGQEMWAGGGAGTLLHSTDNGTIWSVVPVSFKGQSLTSAVTRIEIGTPSSAEIVITTEDHEIWSSVDSGKSWEKK